MLTCDDCGQQYNRLAIFVTRDGHAHAVLNVVCHGHDQDEAWLDATIGSWQKPYSDHVSFSCRVSGAGADLVDGPVARKMQMPHHGAHLSRAQALADRRLPLLLTLVGELVATVPDLSGPRHSSP